MRFLHAFCIPFLLIVTFSNSRLSFSQTDINQSYSDTLDTGISHKRKDPGDRGFVIYSDSGRSSLRFKGEIRLNGAYDLNGLQDQQTFNVYDIPTGPANISDGSFYMGVFQSRFGIEGKIRTGKGDLFVKLEGDFLGNNNNFRIRQAYGKLNRFLLGKTRSLFSDPDAMPEKVDREGPNFSLSERTIQVRFEPSKKNNLTWGVALETPDPDITNSDSAEVSPYYQSIPDAASHIKFENARGGHFQISGIFRNIVVRNLDEDLQILQGYGGLLSGLFWIAKESNFKFQLFGGKSIAHYVKALSGEGLDVIFDDIGNSYVPVTTYGGFVSAYHKWSKIMFSDFTAGAARIVNVQSQADNSFKYGFYGSVNLFVHTFKESELGIEYSHGKRVNIDEESGTANRLSFIVFFYF
jgi:hypothetical protein